MKMYIRFSFMIIAYNILIFTVGTSILKIVIENRPWYNWLIMLLWSFCWGMECRKCTKDFIEARKEYNSK